MIIELIMVLVSFVVGVIFGYLKREEIHDKLSKV